MSIYFVETAVAEQRELLCRWAERFFMENKRVQIVVDSTQAAQLIDQLLWTFSQSSFIPHVIFSRGNALPAEPVLITVGEFEAAGFEAVICDCPVDLRIYEQVRNRCAFHPERRCRTKAAKPQPVAEGPRLRDQHGPCSIRAPELMPANTAPARTISTLRGLWIILASFLEITGKNISKKSEFGVESEKYGKPVSG